MRTDFTIFTMPTGFCLAPATHLRSRSFTRAHNLLAGQHELSARVQDGILDWEKAFPYRGCIERDRLTGEGACATASSQRDFFLGAHRSVPHDAGTHGVKRARQLWLY
jgi:hypothetical protein